MSNYPPRLATSDVKYLALEGGGGKGNVFVGALQALARLDVIQNSGYRLTNILGVAGASAGAITSLFLAMGYSPDELKQITEIEDFDSFLDLSTPGRVFRIGGFENIAPPSGPRTTALVALLQDYLELREEVDARTLLRRIARRMGADVQSSLQRLQDILARLETDPSRHVLTAVTETLGEFRRFGAESALSAFREVREMLRVLPATAWARMARMARQVNRLVGLEIELAVLAEVGINVEALFFLLRQHFPGESYRALLTRNGEDALTALGQDFGIMTGEAIYNFFRRWLAVARWRVANPSMFESYVRVHGTTQDGFRALRQSLLDGTGDPTLLGLRDENFTFRDFVDAFGVKLVLTGSNIETLKTHVFSADTTPNFYVVDAARLSMSLPFGLYKPLIIRADDARLQDVLGPREHVYEADPVSAVRQRHPLIGVWVDGGIYNNIPLHVFDRERNGETLALRLEVDRPAEVTTISSYFLQHPGGTLISSGETQTSHSFGARYQSIALDTGSLDLLSFAPEPEVAEELRQKAIRYVFRYFDREYAGDL